MWTENIGILVKLDLLDLADVNLSQGKLVSRQKANPRFSSFLRFKQDMKLLVCFNLGQKYSRLLYFWSRVCESLNEGKASSLIWRVFICKNISSQHGLIKDQTLITFWEKILANMSFLNFEMGKLILFTPSRSMYSLIVERILIL